MELSGFISVSEVLKSGVYALVYQGVVVYIGKSKTMLIRIYTHRAQRGKKEFPFSQVKGIAFDEVFVRPCPIDKLDALEYDMINLYKPRYNTQLKHFGKSTAEVVLNYNGIPLVLNRPAIPGPKIERRL